MLQEKLYILHTVVPEPTFVIWPGMVVEGIKGLHRCGRWCVLCVLLYQHKLKKNSEIQ